MVSPYTAYSVSIVTANRLEKINLIVAWDSETDLYFFIKIMKKGSIIKGKRVIGVLTYIDDVCKVSHVKYLLGSILYREASISLQNIKIPTRKEKEEYKKALLKKGYSYYRGKVTQEL